MNLFNELISIAKKDLLAAEILYKEKLFPQSVFSFQQSVEKANKAFAFKNKVVKGNELHTKIRHKPSNSLKIFVDDIFLDFDKTKAEYQMLAENLFNKVLPEMDSIKKDWESGSIIFSKEANDYLRNLTEEEIDELLESVYQLDDITVPEFSEVKDEFLVKAKEMIEMLINQNSDKSFQREAEKTLTDENAMLGFADSIYNFNFSPAFRKMGKGIFGLFALALIMQAHAIDSRYPDIDRNFSPEEYYIDTLPLIIKMPELFSIQKDIFEFLEMDELNFTHKVI